MSLPDPTARLATRVAEVLRTLASDPVRMLCSLAALALEHWSAARLSPGPDAQGRLDAALAQVPQALGVEGWSALSARQRLAAALVAVVGRELENAELDEIADADLLRDVLVEGGAAEQLAGLVHAGIDADGGLDEGRLRADLAEWMAGRLKSLCGPGHGTTAAPQLEALTGFTGRLADAILAGLAMDDVVAPRLAHDALQRLLGRVDALGDPGELVRGLEARLSSQLGVPSREQLEKVVATSRGPCADLAFDVLRKGLCSPLHPGDLLHAEGRSPDLPARAVPERFTYLPHRLRVRPDRPALDRGPDEWPEVALAEVVAGLTRPRSGPWRVLVEAPAGFGKTAFLHALALEVAARGEPLALRPVSLREWERSGLPRTPDGLAELVMQQLHLPESWPPLLRQAAAQQLLRRGRAVVFLDGLDQLEGGFATAEDLCSASAGALRLVATCRSELGKGRSCDCFHQVLRLDAPEFDRVPVAQLPVTVREALEGALGEDGGHPFWLHVARVLDHEGALPEGGDSGSLVGAYLDQLVVLGARHAGMDPGDPYLGSEEALRSQRRVMALLALDSLRWCRQRSEPSLGELSDEVYGESRKSLGERLPGVDVGRALGDASRHAALLYRLLEPSHGQRGQVWVFHHQLVQERLAAEGVVEEMARAVSGRALGDRGQVAAKRLSALVGQVVRPEDPRGGEQHPELPDRVLALRLWRFVADLLAGSGSALSPGSRCELVRDLTRELWKTGADPARGARRSALLRIRDELLERDGEVAAAAMGAWGARLEACNDPCARQFSERELTPDPFMLLLWPEEREAIAAQMADAPSTADLEAALQREAGGKWSVSEEPLGAPGVDAGRVQVVAARGHGAPVERWCLVPPGPFVAGDVGFSDEMPVRVERTGAFWVAHHPVTVRDYLAFVGSGYDLADECWRAFQQAAGKSLGDRRAPWGWKDGKPDLPGDVPVVGVSWFEAAAYCRWLNRDRTGSCDGPYRLPSEAEWEKAARGLFGRRWPWGCTWRPGLVVCSDEERRSRPGAVTQRLNVSPFGARGMAGNVWEWTSTAWLDTRFGKSVESPQYEDAVSLRGGSFFNVRHWVRCAYRFWFRAGFGFWVDADGFSLCPGREMIPPCSLPLASLRSWDRAPLWGSRPGCRARSA